MKAKHFNSVSAEYKAPYDDPVEAVNPEPAEMAQLRIRVIALENIVITLLAQSSHRERNEAHAMASYILPRPGYTHHRTTLHAANQMLHLIRRARHFQSLHPKLRRLRCNVLPK